MSTLKQLMNQAQAAIAQGHAELAKKRLAQAPLLQWFAQAEIDEYARWRRTGELPQSAGALELMVIDAQLEELV